MSNVLYSSADNQWVPRTGGFNGLQSTGQGNLSYSIEHFDNWNSGRTGLDVGLCNDSRNYNFHGIGAVQAVICDIWTTVAAYAETAKAEAKADISPNNSDRTAINADQEVRSGN